MRVKDITSGMVMGNRLMCLRKKRFLSQADVAKALGVRREVVTRWEDGTRCIKAADILDLADFYKVSCDYILRGIDGDPTVMKSRHSPSNEEVIECSDTVDVNKLISSGQWKLTATRTVYTLKRT